MGTPLYQDMEAWGLWAATALQIDAPSFEVWWVDLGSWVQIDNETQVRC
jgi:hypothetical protein